MKCVLLFTVLLAAWISSSEATTCDNINSCLTEMSKLGQIDQSNKDEACGAMRNVLSCFKSALQDCKEKNPNMPNIGNVESQMSNVETMVNENCGGGAGAVKISIALLLFALLSKIFM